MNPKVSTFSALAVLVISLGGTVYFHHEQKAISQQNTRTIQQIQLAQKKLTQVKADQKAKQAKLRLTSSNPNIKDTATQQSAYNDANSAVQKFSKITFTFGSQKEWLARQKKVLPYATADLVKNNQNLFNNGKDNTGGDIVSNLHLHYEFQQANVTTSVVGDDGVVTGIAREYIKQWRGDNDPGTVCDMYTFKYDTKSHKLTEFNRVANVYVSAEDY